MSLHTDIHDAADVLKGAGLIAVLSGAGMSKESGVPTFREAQTGLWEQYSPEELATPQAFRRNPNLVWRWYMWRLDLVTRAQPNPGHRAVAELESMVRGLVVLTQNVDGMHQRAGSKDVVELHGNLTRFKCGRDCRGAPTLVDLNTLSHNQEHAPVCPHCGVGLVRPDVVWFGETLPARALERAVEVAAACDVMLVIGTSGAVYPAAGLPHEAKRHGAYVIEVNPQPSAITALADLYLGGPAGVVLPDVIAAIRGGSDEV